MSKFLHRNLNGLVGYHLLASDNNKCLRKNAIFWVQDIRKYNKYKMYNSEVLNVITRQFDIEISVIVISTRSR